MDYSIGELSRKTGVKVPTIRYYEQIGLIAAPDRNAGNQRRYDAAAVETLKFIRHARQLGFNLPAIGDLIALTRTPQETCHHADSIAHRQLEAVTARIRMLTGIRDELARMISDCRHGQASECRVLQVLGDHGECLDADHEHDAAADARF